MNFRLNPLLNTDSYKFSHFLQYPKGAKALYSYIEARKNNSGFNIDQILFFGLQGYIKQFLLEPITLEDLNHAEYITKCHGVPFPKKAFTKLVNVYNGFAPITIRAVKEGTCVGIGEVLMTIECQDSDLFWYGSFLETQILRAVWYGSSIATITKYCKNIITKFLLETCDNVEKELPYKLHDFGARGSSSTETSYIGGAARLVNFLGTDTIASLQWIHEMYNIDYSQIAYSIPAAEHSTITSWGKNNEAEAYINMIENFGKNTFSVVSDSYDIYTAVRDIWGDKLHNLVINLSGTLVIRPDSGDPVTTVIEIIKIVADKFGYTINSKNYKILNNVRIIQGDGINPIIIEKILLSLKEARFSAENVTLGIGGTFFQKINRDTFSFAMKCSAINIDNIWHDVYKDPIAGNKTSKKGKFALIEENKKFKTINLNSLTCEDDNKLELVYENGKLIRQQTFEEIRKLASNY